MRIALGETRLQRRTLLCRVFFSILWLSFVLTSRVAMAQDVSNTSTIDKNKAAQELSQRTPEQIQAELDRRGITLEQATAQAKAIGINLDDFLNATNQPKDLSQQPKPDTLLAKQKRDSLLAKTRKMQADTTKKTFYVPAFKGRDKADSLDAFGYSIFAQSPTTFQPVENMAAPAGYVVGPGDEIAITLWGDVQQQYKLTVSKSGSIVVPNVGQIAVAGSTVSELRQRIFRQMSRVYATLVGPSAQTNLDVTLGNLRTVQVFVLGEVTRPGSYTISSLSGALNSLYLAGGPTINGSLRNIQVIRDTKIISTVDFYDFAINGDRAKDVRIQDGDIIFVKPAGKRAALLGAVLRPAVYELKDDETLQDLLHHAGGLQFNAYFNTISVERIVPFELRQQYTNAILNIDFKFVSIQDLKASTSPIADGDVVTIRDVGKELQNRVVILGSVKKPGNYALEQGMRLRDILVRADSTSRGAFLKRGTLVRTFPNLQQQILPLNPALALQSNMEANIGLQNLDTLFIYSDTSLFAAKKVEILGDAVRKPGVYPRYQGMTLTDLIMLAGGLEDFAETADIDIANIDSTSTTRFATMQKFALPREYWNIPRNQDLLLKDYDKVTVKFDPKRQVPPIVKINGEVTFPSSYALLYKGEKILSLIKRAGGLLIDAYLPGTKLIRKGIGSVPVEIYKSPDDTMSVYNLELVANDSIFIPKRPSLVSVIGKVVVPSSTPYAKGGSPSYYLKQAGGVAFDGDEDRVVIILPNGKKWEASGWFFIPSADILPGSTVYVPQKGSQKEGPSIYDVIKDLTSFAATLVVLLIGIKQLK
jgi:protein involved in polysaccharide export with SLBB domain